MKRRNYRRRQTSWVKRPLLVLASLIALLGVLPFVIPFQLYIPRLEQAVFQGLHEPVSITRIKLALFPVPHIRLEGVAVGPLRDLNIQYVTVYPDLFSLMNSVKTLNSVELDGVNLNDEAIERVSGWIKKSKGPAAFQVREIKLRHVDFRPGKADFGSLQADIALKPEGGLAHATVYTTDERLKIGLQPDGENYAAAFQAKHWRIPLEPNVVFDTLDGEATISHDEMSLHDVDGTLYGGSIEGTAIVNWQGGWKVRGDLKAEDILLESLMPLFTTSASVSGRLNMDGNFQMSAKEVGELMDSQDGSFRFNVKNGVIYNMDMARAVRAATSEVRGGQTSFDRFYGKLQINGKQFYFQDTHIASGLLKARGKLKVGASNEIAGHAKVEITGTASKLSMPMKISGYLSDPVLLPEKTAMAGVVADTAILKPGIGTSVGTKAGGYLNQLFK